MQGKPGNRLIDPRESCPRMVSRENGTSTQTGIVVLGMHRSGTSTVAGVLKSCGVWLGDEKELLPPQPDNPKGFFERKDLHTICQRLLHAADCTWWRLSNFASESVPSSVREDLGEQFSWLVGELAERGTWAIKEPTLSLVFPILERYIADPICVIPVRNPVEIARSLKTRNGFSIPHGIALWEIYTRHALAATEKHARVLVSYSDLIADPHATTDRLLRDLQNAGARALSAPEGATTFVSRDLHRESAQRLDVEALLNADQLQLWSSLESGINLAAEGEKRISRGGLILLKDLEREHGARLEASRELNTARKEAAALLKKLAERETQLREIEEKHRAKAARLDNLHQQHSATMKRRDVEVSELQRQLKAVRMNPLKSFRKKLVSRLLYSLARQSFLFSQRQRDRFHRSAQKRDPNRDDLALMRSKFQSRIAAQVAMPSAVPAYQSITPSDQSRDVKALPKVPMDRAVTASRVPATAEPISREKAAAIIAIAAAPLEAGTQPRRIFPDFDILSAKNYVLAAEALYDADRAALKASVVMPTYNRGGQIAGAVRSVLDQSHRNLELLVIDDGSDDNTQEQLAAFSADPRLRVLVRDHVGVSSARNAGLENASGEYVFYLDSDNAWTADYIKLMLAGLQETGADCAYAATCVVNEAGDLIGYRGEPFDWDSCLEANYVDMNIFAHRRTLFDQCGGFDTTLRRMVDWDLILRYTKFRSVPFFPFIGCVYLNHASDPTRISVSQPFLYGRMVAEKNRLNLESGSEALASLKLSFAIKIPAPFKNRAEWGDFHYAESLSNALQRLGHSVRIDFRGEWDNPKAWSDDVVLVLRGLSEYTPRPGQLTLIWNISHPDQVSYDEYSAFHCVLIASRSYAALLSMILERPVYPLLQCTDTERFNFPDHLPPANPEGRGVFVGNSRNDFRAMVRWSVENDVDLDIYGSRWSQFIPEALIAGENIPNTELAERYRLARFVLNDHWQSMKDFGFVSNRVFDVIGCGGTLISDSLPSLEAIFGTAVETVRDGKSLVEAVSKPPYSPEERREVAEYVREHHSFDTRARDICDAVKGAMTTADLKVTAEPNFAPSAPRRRVGLILQRGRAWWTSSAYIRLICPLTTDYAHERACLDIVALDGADDPQIDECDICIVQRVAVPESETARRLIDRLRCRDVPLYVDTDDAFFLHKTYRAADVSLRLLMEAAREVWFSTPNLAELYEDVARGKSRVRRNDLDPRLWRDYRKPVDTTFCDGQLRFVYMGTNTHHGDLETVIPAFERLERDYPGSFNLTLVGVTSNPPKAEWLYVRNPSQESGGYPAFARFLTRELKFDVGIAPLKESRFNAAKSDIKFLDYSAMGLLSVVAEGPVYRDCIDAGLAVGCDATFTAWYEAFARIVENRSHFAEMRQCAADHIWRDRNIVEDLDPLADLLV